MPALEGRRLVVVSRKARHIGADLSVHFVNRLDQVRPFRDTHELDSRWRRRRGVDSGEIEDDFVLASDLLEAVLFGEAP